MVSSTKRQSTKHLKSIIAYMKNILKRLTEKDEYVMCISVYHVKNIVL